MKQIRDYIEEKISSGRKEEMFKPSDRYGDWIEALEGIGVEVVTADPGQGCPDDGTVTVSAFHEGGKQYGRIDLSAGGEWFFALFNPSGKLVDVRKVENDSSVESSLRELNGKLLSMLGESVAHGKRYVLKSPEAFGLCEGGRPNLDEIKRYVETLGYKKSSSKETDSKVLCKTNNSRIYVEFDTPYNTHVLKMVDPDRRKTFSVITHSDTRILKRLTSVDVDNENYGIDSKYYSIDLNDQVEEFLEELK